MNGAPIELGVRIARDDVLRGLGYPPGRQPPSRIATLIDETLAEARDLVRGRGLWIELAPERAAEVGLDPVEAERLAVGLVTAGAGIERRASEHAEAGRATRGLLLDAAGSVAAEEAADRLSALINAGEAPGERAVPVPCRISPGYGRWPLSAQRQIFSLLPAARLGLELTGSLMMVPRKSISFALWLGATREPRQGLAGCRNCRLTHCNYRRETEESSDG